jgi:mono/diheme cytochrome c family protein
VVFERDCSSCHSLIGNESRHRPGGDLLGYTLTRQQLLEQTRQMPVRRPLSRPELNAVVDYVAAMQKRARSAGSGGAG